MKEHVIQRISEKRVIVVTNGIYGEGFVELSKALYAGGVELIELVLEQDNVDQNEQVFTTVKLLRRELGNNLVVGIGNVFSRDNIILAKDYGADFVSFLDANDALIMAANDNNLVSIAGALTPTEIVYAYNCGSDFVKVYPACSVGPAYFTNIHPMLKHIPLLVHGGINRSNVRLYKNAGIEGFCVDDCLFNQSQVENCDWKQIAEITRSFLQTI